MEQIAHAFTGGFLACVSVAGFALTGITILAVFVLVVTVFNDVKQQEKKDNQ